MYCPSKNKLLFIVIAVCCLFIDISPHPLLLSALFYPVEVAQSNHIPSHWLQSELWFHSISSYYTRYCNINANTHIASLFDISSLVQQQPHHELMTSITSQDQRCIAILKIYCNNSVLFIHRYITSSFALICALLPSRSCTIESYPFLLATIKAVLPYYLITFHTLL